MVDPTEQTIDKLQESLESQVQELRKRLEQSSQIMREEVRGVASVLGALIVNIPRLATW